MRSFSDQVSASPSRVECATAVRELSHSIVGHAVADDVLDRITAFVRDMLPDVESAGLRSRPVDDMKRRLFEVPSIKAYVDGLVAAEAAGA